MDNTQKLLQISAKLFQHLTEYPKEEARENYIDALNSMLDERGLIINGLLIEGFKVDTDNRAHITLIELDKGIRERLELFMDSVKQDMKNLQTIKKNEKQYFNPYSDVRVMDGMYFDKKK
ncbi:flagellar protein FliT [Lysinibacillus antri]|uniref:Flagellar protein FliT n=1 Tax=Lysinibacillus antri TaxID=2498145 RepID=A0A432LD70_9BACI|nr:flagellar protein FliT [Lysinibacillus antri]RUL54205.1 flagellar protein FliT [Lysinibacillus antri]